MGARAGPSGQWEQVPSADHPSPSAAGAVGQGRARAGPRPGTGTVMEIEEAFADEPDPRSWGGAGPRAEPELLFYGDGSTTDSLSSEFVSTRTAGLGSGPGGGGGAAGGAEPARPGGAVGEVAAGLGRSPAFNLQAMLAVAGISGVGQAAGGRPRSEPGQASAELESESLLGPARDSLYRL